MTSANQTATTRLVSETSTNSSNISVTHMNMTTISEFNDFNMTSTQEPSVVNRALFPNMVSRNNSLQNLTTPSSLTTHAMNENAVNFTTFAGQPNFTFHNEYNNETTFGSITSEAENITSTGVISSSTVEPTKTPITSTTTSLPLVDKWPSIPG